MPEDELPVAEFEQALLSLDRLTARRLLATAAQTWPPVEVVEGMVVPALERIGAGWEQGQVALSQVYMSGRICEELVDAFLPAADPARRSQPRMAIASIGDYHQLGKRIVYSVLRASGFELLDYGHGLGADRLVAQVMEDGVAILFLSALMLPSALQVGEVTARLSALGADVKVVVGGAPFSFDGELWREVGADAMGRSAAEAVGIARRLTEEMP